MIPAMLAVQDTVQTTVDSVANLGGHSHDHDHGHGLGVHTHGLDMEHMGVALLAAIIGIGAKEGYGLCTNTFTYNTGSLKRSVRITWTFQRTVIGCKMFN